MTDNDKPAVQLSGANGNAFAVVGVCRRAMAKHGWESSKIDAVLTDMMSGDYDHLLQVALEHFDVS